MCYCAMMVAAAGGLHGLPSPSPSQHLKHGVGRALKTHFLRIRRREKRREGYDSGKLAISSPEPLQHTLYSLPLHAGAQFELCAVIVHVAFFSSSSRTRHFCNRFFVVDLITFCPRGWNSQSLSLSLARSLPPGRSKTTKWRRVNKKKRSAATPRRALLFFRGTHKVRRPFFLVSGFLCVASMLTNGCPWPFHDLQPHFHDQMWNLRVDTSK